MQRSGECLVGKSSDAMSEVFPLHFLSSGFSTSIGYTSTHVREHLPSCSQYVS